MPTTTPTDAQAQGSLAPGRLRSRPTWRRSSANHRQVRRVLLFVCTPGLVLGASTLATASALGAFDPAPHTVQASCHRPVDPTSFEVAVLNGSGLSGQARKGARQLTKAGFRVTRVGTAAENRWTDASAVISFGPSGRGAAQLVATHIPGAVLVGTVREGSDVDIVLGTRFSDIATAAVPTTGSSAPSCSTPVAR